MGTLNHFIKEADRLFANIDERHAGCVPTSREVFDALCLMGFRVGMVRQIHVNPMQSNAEYAVVILGQADSDPFNFQRDVLGAFCEQAQVLSLHTRYRDVFLMLQLTA